MLRQVTFLDFLRLWGLPPSSKPLRNEWRLKYQQLEEKLKKSKEDGPSLEWIYSIWGIHDSWCQYIHCHVWRKAWNYGLRRHMWHPAQRLGTIDSLKKRPKFINLWSLDISHPIFDELFGYCHHFPSTFHCIFGVLEAKVQKIRASPGQVAQDGQMRAMMALMGKTGKGGGASERAFWGV